MNKKWLICVFALLAIAQKLHAGEIDSDLFAKANEAYRNHNYGQALSGYEQISRNYSNSEIYYNLANAAFKENQLGKAILNYLKAKRLNPRDPDIRKNLKYAQGMIEYRVEDKSNWYWKQLMKGLDYIRLSECVLILLFIYFVLISGLSIAVILNRELSFRKISGVLIGILIFSTLPTLIKFSDVKMRTAGVVIDGKVDVRYGPSKEEKLAFNLVEGIELRIDDQTDEWYRISLANGETGWTLKKGIEKV